ATRTRYPCSTKAPARLITVVVLPVPPLPCKSAIVYMKPPSHIATSKVNHTKHQTASDITTYITKYITILRYICPHTGHTGWLRPFNGPSPACALVHGPVWPPICEGQPSRS